MKTGVLVALGLALLAASIFGPMPLVLAWNTSASVPTGLYLIVSRPRRIGDYVLVHLSAAMQVLAERRSYIGPNTPLLKRVVAKAGDRVCRRGPDVLIPGQKRVIALGSDRGGRLLPVWHGCHRLQHGQVFILGTHQESFDSRYFGPVPSDQIIGVAIPLFIVRS